MTQNPSAKGCRFVQKHTPTVPSCSRLHFRAKGHIISSTGPCICSTEYMVVTNNICSTHLRSISFAQLSRKSGRSSTPLIARWSNMRDFSRGYATSSQRIQNTDRILVRAQLYMELILCGCADVRTMFEPTATKRNELPSSYTLTSRRSFESRSEEHQEIKIRPIQSMPLDQSPTVGSFSSVSLFYSSSC